MSEDMLTIEFTEEQVVVMTTSLRRVAKAHRQAGRLANANFYDQTADSIWQQFRERSSAKETPHG